MNLYWHAGTVRCCSLHWHAATFAAHALGVFKLPNRVREMPVPWRIHKTGRRVPSNLSDTAISASLAPRLLHKFLGTRFVFGQTYVFKRLSFCYFDLSLPLTRSKLCDPRSHCACMWFRDLCSSGDLFPLIMRVYDSGL